MKTSASRTELYKLFSDNDNIELTSLSLKTKVSRLKRKILSGQMSEDTAVDILYNDCIDHYDLYKSDLYRIFSE